MQDIRLYINDIQIEIASNEKIFLSSKVNQIGVPESIKSKITQTFKIYKTNNNLKAFDYLGLANANSQIPYTDVDAKLYVNGIEIFKRGKIGSITNNNNYWAVVLKEGNTNFFSVISEYSIQDLDLSEFENTWVQSNIIASRANTEGQIYPIVDWGALSSHNNYINSREMLPAIFEKTIWNAIFDKDKNPAISENWNYTGKLFSDENFTKAIIPCLTNYFDSAASEYYILNAERNATTDIADNSSYTVVYDNVISDESGSLRLSTFYDISVVGTYSITANVELTRLLGFGNVLNVTIEIIRNSSVLESLYLPFFVGTNSVQALSFSGEIQSGEISLKITTDGVASVSDVLRIDNVEFLINPDLTESTLTYNASNFPLARNLPDISQKDFLKQRMLLNGAIAQTNVVTNTVRFVKFQELETLKDSGNVNDYSEKLDLTKITNFDASNFNVNYVLSELNKRNYIKFKADETVSNDFANSYFDLESIRYIDEKTFIEFLYAASESDYYLDLDFPIPIISDIDLKIISITKISDIGGGKSRVEAKSHELKPLDFAIISGSVNYNGYHEIISFDDDTFDINITYAGDERGNFQKANVDRNFKVKPRILLTDKQNVSIEFQDGLTTDIVTGEHALCTFDDFKAFNLIDSYYDAYINAVSKPEILTAKYLLNIDEFDQFDHFTLIYDKAFNAFFFIEEITRFNPDNSSTFKMLKIE